MFGFDICPNNIANAQKCAAKYNLAERTHFAVGVAETLNYPSDYFDVIVGVDILHHVDINRAISECFRVLKKGGIAIFHEPIRVPVFEFWRESKLGLALVPKTASLDRHLTEDERKLDDNDLNILNQADPRLRMQRFLLSSRLGRFIPNGKTVLEKLDQQLFNLLPALSAVDNVAMTLAPGDAVAL